MANTPRTVPVTSTSATGLLSPPTAGANLRATSPGVSGEEDDPMNGAGSGAGAGAGAGSTAGTPAKGKSGAGKKKKKGKK